MSWARPEPWVVVGYILLTVLVGIAVRSRNRDGTDFFAGGRAVPWWVSGVSLYMGNFSAWMFTGGAGLIYRTTGYGMLYFFLTGAVAYTLGSQMTAARWRRTRVLSPVEFTRLRFGPATQQLLGLVTSAVFLLAAGNQLRALATIVETSLGLPLVTAAIGIAALVTVYTLIGGVWAVMVTDVLQCVVLVAIAIVLAPLCIALLPGGFGELLSTVRFSLTPADGLASHDGHFLVAGLLSFTLGVASGAGPRFYCVPAERDARRAGALAGALFLTTPLLFAIPSLAARGLWGGPDVLAETISGTNPHEQVFVHMAREALPPGLVGIFLAAMFAATMSALDSVFNQVAAVMTRDVYLSFRPRATDRQLLPVGRLTTLICGAITLGLCLVYAAGSSDLFTVMTDIFFLAAPITAAPLLMGLLHRTAPRGTALLSMSWGLVVGLVTRTLLHWGTGPQTYLTQGVCLAAFLLAPGLVRLAGKLGTVGSTVASLGLGGAVTALLTGFSEATSGVRFELAEISFATGLSSTAISALTGLTMAILLGLFLRAALREGEEDRRLVAEFHARLDRPVDREREVTGSAHATLATFRLVGQVTGILAAGMILLMVLEPLLDRSRPFSLAEYGGVILVLVGFTVLFLRLGRPSRGEGT